jgi:hypothetical protein
MTSPTLHPGYRWSTDYGGVIWNVQMPLSSF